MAWAPLGMGHHNFKQQISTRIVSQTLAFLDSLISQSSFLACLQLQGTSPLLGRALMAIGFQGSLQPSHPMILTESTKRLESLLVATENPSWQSVSNWQTVLMNIQSKGSTRAGCSPTSSLSTTRQALTCLLRSHDPEMIHKATQKPESSAIYSHQILTYIIKHSIREPGELKKKKKNILGQEITFKLWTSNQCKRDAEHTKHLQEKWCPFKKDFIQVKIPF